MFSLTSNFSNKLILVGVLVNKEFVVKYKLPKESKLGFLIIIPIFIFNYYLFLNIAKASAFYEHLFFIKGKTFLAFIFLLVKILLYSFSYSIIFMGGLILYFLISNFLNNVVAVVNEEGVKVKYSGFIPWEYVDRIETYQAKYSPKAPIQLALWIRLDKEIRKHLSIGTKMGIFWSKITRNPHITFGSMDSEENLRILEFAQECLKKH